MPKFALVPKEEVARRAATTGKRAQITQEYLGYLEQLGEGRTGRLQVTEGERMATVRRRLGVVAKLASKKLVTRRVGEDLYFWLASQPKGTPGRRRGRPPRAARPGS